MSESPSPGSTPSTTPDHPACAQCGQHKSVNNRIDLKVCAKCHNIRYCSRECQKAHWKMHKPQCGKISSNEDDSKTSSNGNGASSDKGPIGFSHMSIDTSNFNPGPYDPSVHTGPVDTPLDLDRTLATFSGIFSRNPPKAMRDAVYINSLTRPEAHQAIIDAYRLRVNDEYVFQGKTRGLYAGLGPYPDFVAFLDCAERKGGILPRWWGKDARLECENLAQDPQGNWFIGHAVEKDDIIEAYDDRLAPMRLRMFAQLIEGTRVG